MIFIKVSDGWDGFNEMIKKRWRLVIDTNKKRINRKQKKRERRDDNKSERGENWEFDAMAGLLLMAGLVVLVDDDDEELEDEFEEAAEEK